MDTNFSKKVSSSRREIPTLQNQHILKRDFPWRHYWMVSLMMSNCPLCFHGSRLFYYPRAKIVIMVQQKRSSRRNTRERKMDNDDIVQQISYFCCPSLQIYATGQMFSIIMSMHIVNCHECHDFRCLILDKPIKRHVSKVSSIQ